MAQPLAIGFDTAANNCSVAIVNETQVLASINKEMKMGQSEALIPMLDEVLTLGSIRWSQLSMIGVGVGPGNFTGIRIAVATARGLALALGVRSIGITSFEVMAPQKGWALLTIDGKNGDILTQLFNDGIAKEPPKLNSLNSLANTVFPAGTKVFGFNQKEISTVSNLKVGPTKRTNRAVTIGKIVIKRINEKTFSPTPLYIKQPNISLSTDPTLKIIAD